MRREGLFLTGVRLAIVGFVLSLALIGAGVFGASGTSSGDISKGVHRRRRRICPGMQELPRRRRRLRQRRGRTRRTWRRSVPTAGRPRITCTYTYSDSMGCRSTSVAAAKYLSAADIVDEAKVVPPLYLVTGVSTTATGSCGMQPSSVDYFYDDQRRLTQMVVKSASGAQTTSLYRLG